MAKLLGNIISSEWQRFGNVLRKLSLMVFTAIFLATHYGGTAMAANLDVPDERFGGEKSAPCIVMMPLKDLDPSPFGPDVNPPATPEEELSLFESVSKNGVQVPLTAGRVVGKGRYGVVKGTRRYGVALQLGLREVPAVLKEYQSDEEMRQDALRDNLERRQLSPAGRAALANALWRSFDIAPDKKEMAAQGLSPRKRAAIAGGLSEGALASYRYVLDTGNVDLIGKMRSGEFTIGKAVGEARKVTEGKRGAAKAAADLSAAEQVKTLRDTFEDLVRAAGILRDTVKRGKEVVKLAKKGQVNDLAALIKQMQTVNPGLFINAEPGVA